MAETSTVGTSRIFAPVQDGPTDVGEEVLPYAPRRLLVKLKANAMKGVRAQGGPLIGIESLDALGRQLRVKSIRPAYRSVSNRVLGQALGVDRWHLIELDQNDLISSVVSRYAADPNVEMATPDWRAFPLVEPNDPLHSAHWGHDNNGQMPDYCWQCGGHENGSPVGNPGFDANTEDAWGKRQGFGDSMVVIAILDSGVDLDHPDLRLIAGWDYGDGDSNPNDDSLNRGHGTACAGVAAAISNNGIGPAGAAGGVSIMPLKIANAFGAIYFSAIQNALYDAADNGADIASMSFGAEISNDPATDTAIQYAYDNGVTLFAATGNDNGSTILYPANHALVIAVGAASPCGGRKRSSSSLDELNPGVSPDPNDYTCDGERWWGSNYGSNIRDTAGAVDVIAPTILPTTDIGGTDGYSADDYYKWFNGTSAATPYAAGVAALILSADPGLTPSQIRQQIIESATDVVNVESGAGWDRYSGYGMINAAAAIDEIPLPSADAYGHINGGDQDHIFEVNYSFGGHAGNVALYYEVWDVDNGTEVEIILNGTQIGYAPVTANESWGGVQVITLPDAFVNDSSTNYLTFNNTFNPPRRFWWGVRNVSVDVP
jgi:subtilisin family serine protease